MDRSRPRTVLHVISSLGQLGGGAERQLLLYFQHRSDHWRHVVAYRKPHALLREDVEKAGVTTVWLGPGGFVRQLIQLMRIARAESADAIHTYLFEANHLGRLAGRLLRIPVITTVTNTLEVEDRRTSGDYAPWKYRVALALEALTARWGTFRFIAISETVKQSTVHTLGIAPPRVRVVYRAVRGQIVDGAGPPSADPILITTGRLMPHKGQDLLIRMFPLVLREWPRCVLQVVGEGPHRKALETLADDLGIVERVHFLGLRPDVGQLLRQANLFIYASRYEGFANSFAEAIAGGLPVVAVGLPVFREIAPQQSVILVDRDEGVFAGAVLRVLADLESFRDAARQESVRFRERFSIQTYVRDTEAVYTEASGGAS